MGLCIHVCELNNAGKLLWAKKQIEKVHLTGGSKSLLGDAVLGVGLGQRGLHRQDSRPALPTCRLAAVRRAHLHVLHALGRTAGGLMVPTRYLTFAGFCHSCVHLLFFIKKKSTAMDQVLANGKRSAEDKHFSQSIRCVSFNSP